MKKIATILMLITSPFMMGGCSEETEIYVLESAYQIVDEETYTYEFIDDKRVVISDGTNKVARLYELNGNEGVILDSSNNINFIIKENQISILGLDDEEYPAKKIEPTEQIENFDILGSWEYNGYEVPKYYEFGDDYVVKISVSDDEETHIYEFENKEGTIEYKEEVLYLIPFGDQLIVIDNEGNSEVLTKNQN